MCDVIVKKIEEMGLVASVMDRLDNGVIKYGITIGRSESQKVRPIFYPQSYTGTADEIANAMVSDYLIMEKGLTVDQAFLMSKAAIISNIYVGLQGCFGENIVKRPCEFKGLEEYLYVVKKHGDKYATSKLSEQAISLYGLSVEEAWNAAYENTKASTCIRSMASVLQEFFPGEMPADAETGADFLYVISNQDNYRGAACALAGKEMVMSLAREKKAKRVILLPSSIHEFVVIFDNGFNDADDFVEMVTKVNDDRSIIRPEDKLISNAYVWDVD